MLNEVAAGLSNKDIAFKLSLKENTVKTQMSALMAKLDARDRAHAVTLGYELGLVDASPYARPTPARAARVVRRFIVSGDARRVREAASCTPAAVAVVCDALPADITAWEGGATPHRDYLVDYAWCLEHLDRLGRLPDVPL